MAKNLTKLICALLVITLLALVVFFGIGTKENKIFPAITDDGAIIKGLDLAGGTSLTYEPDTENSDAVTQENMDIVISILTRRLTDAGYTEASITQLQDDGRFQIEIPGESDIDASRNLLGNIGELMFLASDGTVVLTGSDIKGASAEYGNTGMSAVPEHFVSITLKDEGVKKFSEATKNVSTPEKIADGSNWIMILLDGQIMSMPRVDEQLTEKEVMITGDFDEAGARELASVIASGQLPFKLREISAEVIGPSLGQDALKTSIFAGLIGIILIAVFMIIVYRLPGLVSVIALAAYMAIEGILLVAFKVNLSLPGIAGIILSIGMAVDANVIINERIKEEIRSGKGVLSSVKYGFKGAFSSIIDSNITTIIAAVVLMIFGTGTVTGFAITLLIGVLVSMFTALVITRFIMNTVAKLGVNNPKLYGM